MAGQRTASGGTTIATLPIAENRALSNVDVARLPDLELARHLEECEALVFAGYRKHFELHGTDLLPLGVYLAAVQGVGNRNGGRTRSRRRGRVRHAPVEPRPRGSRALCCRRVRLRSAAFLRAPRRGGRATHADRAAPSFAASRLDRVDEIVPPEHREAFDILLGDARTVFPVRDDNGVVLGAWRLGLLRARFLEIGQRLQDDRRDRSDGAGTRRRARSARAASATGRTAGSARAMGTRRRTAAHRDRCGARHQPCCRRPCAASPWDSSRWAT